MAKKSKSRKTVERKERKSRGSVRERMSRVRAKSRSSGLRWGEIALAALVGYEGDNILKPVGAPISALMGKNEYTAQMQNAFSDEFGASGGQNGPGNMNLGAYEANKLMGLAAILKAGYDVVKHKRLSESDKNILIPYGIGTVFDGPSSKSSTSGGWK